MADGIILMDGGILFNDTCGINGDVMQFNVLYYKNKLKFPVYSYWDYVIY